MTQKFRESLIVDPEDQWLIDSFSWCRQQPIHYAAAQVPGMGRRHTKMLLHHCIMGKPLPSNGSRMTVDHINRNPLDNRRCNLRIVPYSINLSNRAPYVHPQNRR